MGTGKGGVEYYVAVVKPGRILYEIEGVTRRDRRRRRSSSPTTSSGRDQARHSGRAVL